MELATVFSDYRILSLIVTYQAEGPRIDYALGEAGRVGLKAALMM